MLRDVLVVLGSLAMVVVLGGTLVAAMMGEPQYVILALLTLVACWVFGFDSRRG